MTSIRDVAKHAGVAISTVSKVVNNYPGVSQETKEKVNKAIEELDFVPNAVAAALSSKQAGRIALIVSLNKVTKAIDEINMQYISGAINQAQQLGLDVITLFTSMLEDKSTDEIIRYLKAQNIAGLVIFGISKTQNKLHGIINSGAFKTVVVDAPFYNAHTSSVWIDNKQAQYDIVEKTLKSDQCDSILYIAGEKQSYVMDERLAGMEELVKEHNISMLVKYGDFSELKAREITMKHARKRGMVVCASDLMAIGAMKALIDMDIFRPVCGFDGITLMGYVGMQMNTVKQNFARIGSEAVTECGRLLSGEMGRNIKLDYELVRMRYEDIIR